MDERDQKAMNEGLNPPPLLGDVRRSYRAGMMQGFRMLQCYMTWDQEERFGFHDSDKINATLDKQADEWCDDIDSSSERITTFVQWLEDNHSIHIHDMIVIDFLRYGK